MRSYHDPQIFFKKMKKKPALQHIIDNIDDYTNEDIEKTSQPKWIREQLILYKKHGGYAIEASKLFTFDILEPEKYEIVTVQEDFWMEYGNNSGIKKEVFVEKGTELKIGSTHVLFNNERFLNAKVG